MIKEKKEKQDLSIPRIPDKIYVIYTDKYVLLTGIKASNKSWEKFLGRRDVYILEGDFGYSKVLEMAEAIARGMCGLIINAVEFDIYDPMITDPIKIDEQAANLAKIIANIKK